MALILVNLALIAAAFVIQSSVFPLFPFLSASPNLLLILTVSFAFMGGSRTGMLYGLAAGLLQDLFYGGPMGFYTLFYLCAGYLDGIFSRYYYEDYITLPLVLSVVNELAYNLYIYLFRFLPRGRVDFLCYLRELIVPETIFTAVVTLFLYRFLLYVSRRLREHAGGKDQTLV